MKTFGFLPSMGDSKGYLVTAYLVFGILLSQLSHIAVYKGIEDLNTWFNWVAPELPKPSIGKALTIYFLAALAWSIIGVWYFRLSSNLSVNWIVGLGVAFWVSCLVCSQMISSSVMRLVDETIIFATFVAHVIIRRVFLHEKISPATYRELWDLLRLFTPIAISVPIIVGGGSFITAFYKENTGFLQLQIYRQFSVAFYAEVGIIMLLIWPVFKGILWFRDQHNNQATSLSKQSRNIKPRPKKL